MYNNIVGQPGSFFFFIFCSLLFFSFGGELNRTTFDINKEREREREKLVWTRTYDGKR
jgi:hypothetical protein